MSMDRRTFLQLAVAAGGGIMLGVMPGCANPQRVRMEDLAQSKGAFAPNYFLTITEDDRILVACNKSEMGQGVFMGTATLIAEELEVPLEKIEVFHAYKPQFGTSFGGMQITGGSTSTPENYLPVRRAGAAAREMLITAAAANWGARRGQLKAENGFVVHADGRKASYGSLTRDAAKLEIDENPRLKDPKDFKLIGKPQTRVDAYEKVTGTAVYGADFKLPNMLKAAVIHPPVLGASATSVDKAEAEKMVGVKKIFAFERGVAVVAEKYWQARAAAAKVKVEWSDGNASGLNSDAVIRDAREQVETTGPANTMVDEGDVDGALESSEKTLNVTYDAPYLAHAPMEPMNCTVWVKDGGAKIWTPTQSPTMCAEAASMVLGVKREDIEVAILMLGGGFGRRGVPDYVSEATMIAKHFDVPVQVIWTRENDMKATFYRPAAAAQMRGAIDGGKITAYSYHGASQSILKSSGPSFGAVMPDWLPKVAKRMLMSANAGVTGSGSLPDFIATEGVADLPYEIPNRKIGYTQIHTGIAVSFWRSVGHSFNGFITESFIDELAELAGEDPVEFRRKNIREKRHKGVFDAVVRMSKWNEPLEDGWGRGIAVHKSFGTYCAQVAEAKVVDGRIKVRKVYCAVDCGTAVNPDVVHAQMEGGIIFGLAAALDQQINIVDGVVQQENFDDFPILRMNECPEIEIEIVDTGLNPTGVGEPGTPPIPAAVANAIFAATGKRLRSMPLQHAWNATEAG